VHPWICSIATFALALSTACTAWAQRSDCDAPAFARVLQPAAGQAEARAHWLGQRLIRWPGAAAPDSRFVLLHAPQGGIAAVAGRPATGARERVRLERAAAPLPAALAERFKFVADGVDLALPAGAARGIDRLLRGESVLVEEAPDGTLRRVTALQVAGALDERFATAVGAPALGANVEHGRTRFALWAPTAERVWACVHDTANGPSTRLLPLQRNAATGVWRGGLAGNRSGAGYTYLVDVFVRGMGWVRNRVTDPYSLSLTADSQRSVVTRLDAAALKPEGWDATPSPGTVSAPTDMVIYELHVRDFSIGDASVTPGHRGKYGAFTENGSDGMRHLAALARAGLTDLHLLPVFDIASIPERGCTTPAIPAAAPDSEAQQAAAMAVKPTDCYNWGYDPLHYTAPEGSYATDASDGAVRVREFRAMVQALHRTGLRVGMDVVYNHTPAAGQDAKSVLDRIVPGYYHRLNAAGEVEHSTCCANTATEHAMMGRLLIDSVLTWARDYRIDSFRFDLMGHQPRSVMVELQRRLRAATGRDVPLIGEGWNFGEVKDGARFVQASQLGLNGTGIGSFSDRGRDAVRGGSASDSGERLVSARGWIHGPAVAAAAADPQALARQADGVRVALAGTLRRYRMVDASGQEHALQDMRYGADQPAGFASQPAEAVNYVESHDNHTLFDIGTQRLPADTSREDRARVQTLGAAVVAFSQGVAYFHAGQDILRSKSGDRNSYDSGDWFNRLDWTYRDNGFGAGLPPADDNRADWPFWRPVLADARIKPLPADIAWARDAFRDLLKIRASSTLFRLRTADEVARRLRFANTGPQQLPYLVAGHLDGRGLDGARFDDIVYLINAGTQAASTTLPGLAGRAMRLHPVHLAGEAADLRARQARYDTATGRFEVPARTAVVFVSE
jgi:pullulanase/glycogen debranching enzyme